MRKKVIIIANFTQLPNENGNNRFMYLANLLSKDTDVTLVTSSFSHIQKVQRDKCDFENGVNIVQIYEPGYKKNVSFNRFYSHYIFGKNVKKYLNSIEKPDVIYCAIPSLSAAKEAAKYAKSNGIRFIVDVQDLWPEAFKMVFKIPVLSDLIFFPFSRLANYSYSHADDIVAVSETYANRVARVNSKYKNKISVFLGTELDYFDKYKEENKIEFNDNIVRIVYIGTLGTSYDIKSIIDAVNILNNKAINNIKFVIMGDGPLKEEFQKYANEKGVDCEFTGRLDYEKMVGLLCSCDIAVNPIVGDSVASIINKVGDFAAAGLPVINTQNSEEYKLLLEQYNAGINCINTDIIDISMKIEKLIKDVKLRKKMGKGSRQLAEERFDRKLTYPNIVKLLKGNNI